MWPRKVLAVLVCGAAVGVSLWPLCYWMRYPELTQMQVFLKFWWASLFGPPTFILGYECIWRCAVKDADE